MANCGNNTCQRTKHSNWDWKVDVRLYVNMMVDTWKTAMAHATYILIKVNRSEDITKL